MFVFYKTQRFYRRIVQNDNCIIRGEEMLIYKFDSMNSSERFLQKIDSFKDKTTNIERGILNENDILVFVEASRTGDSELMKQIASLIVGYKYELVPYKRRNFELMKLRYYEHYLKSEPLSSFKCSEPICKLIHELEEGGKKYLFIGVESDNYIRSFLSHQFAIKYIHFLYPKDLKEIRFFIDFAKRRGKKFIFVLSSKQSFVSKELFKDLSKENSPYINILVTHIDKKQGIYLKEYKEITIEKKKINEIKNVV